MTTEAGPGSSLVTHRRKWQQPFFLLIIHFNGNDISAEDSISDWPGTAAPTGVCSFSNPFSIAAGSTDSAVVSSTAVPKIACRKNKPTRINPRNTNRTVCLRNHEKGRIIFMTDLSADLRRIEFCAEGVKLRTPLRPGIQLKNGQSLTERAAKNGALRETGLNKFDTR